MLKSLRAALNLAAEHDPRITNHAARKTGLRGLPDARRDRNVILDDDQVRAIVTAAYERDRALGLLVEVCAITGARPSQVARLAIADLEPDPHKPRLMMPHSGKGGSRNRVERKARYSPVPITAALAMKLKGAAAGRPRNAPLLVMADGAPWGKDIANNYAYAMKAVIAAAGLDSSVTMYALRHSSIVRQLLANIPIRVIASTHDTSVAMIEQHYSRHIAHHSDDLSRRALLQDEPIADNVVAITGR
jgi:integrase